MSSALQQPHEYAQEYYPYTRAYGHPAPYPHAAAPVEPQHVADGGFRAPYTHQRALSYAVDAIGSYSQPYAHPPATAPEAPVIGDASQPTQMAIDNTQSNPTQDSVDAPAPVDQDQVAVLVSRRQREVKELLATRAMPLANWNARFMWYSIMKQEHGVEAEFVYKIKDIHKSFYVPPAISFYALWLHSRFWNTFPRLRDAVETRLPATFGTNMSADARTSLFLYMMAVLFANKHLDDFSYRNSSWYEAAGVPAGEFLRFELIALEELHWSLEISTPEWIHWLEILGSSNAYLERTNPMHAAYHQTMASAVYEGLVDIHTFIGQPLPGTHGFVHHHSSPVFVPAPAIHTNQGIVYSHGPAYPADVNDWRNQVQPSYDAYPIVDSIENVKYIPWDTSEDPVVHLRTAGRRGSRSSFSSLTSSASSSSTDLRSVNGVDDIISGVSCALIKQQEEELHATNAWTGVEEGYRFEEFSTIPKEAGPYRAGEFGAVGGKSNRPQTRNRNFPLCHGPPQERSRPFSWVSVSLPFRTRNATDAADPWAITL